VASPIDGPTDHFRIRLVCTLVDSASQYIDSGASRRKLDSFLVFFQVRWLTRVRH